jgi:hypothetical protein
MRDLILFDRVVVRIKRAVVFTAIAIVGGVMKLGLLHISHDWEDRITAVAILIAASTRPAAYVLKKDDYNVNDKYQTL